MKTLFLLRHAKSSHKDETLNDIDRPLNERGNSDTKLIGAVIRRKKIRPDLIVCSPAVRTRQTVDLVLKSARLKMEVTFDQRIYEASPRVLFTILKEITEPDTVMLIGHNPGLEDLLASLTGQALTLPTAALASVELTVEQWNMLGAGKGKLVYRLTPKELKAGQANSKVE